MKKHSHLIKIMLGIFLVFFFFSSNTYVEAHSKNSTAQFIVTGDFLPPNLPDTGINIPDGHHPLLPDFSPSVSNQKKESFLEKIKNYLPQTGEKIKQFSAILGLILISIACYLIFYKKKRKEKESFEK